jgi:hypothetical protein
MPVESKDKMKSRIKNCERGLTLKWVNGNITEFPMTYNMNIKCDLIIKIMGAADKNFRI